MFSVPTGLTGLLKEGSRHFTGKDETTYKHIEACKKLASITRTSLGPNCMNKLIINHIEKLFVTSDASTILDQLEVQHPAAKLIVQASSMQEQEFGDATNYTVVFAGELLNRADVLLRRGLHIANIKAGYEMALEKAADFFEKNVCYKISNPRNPEEIKTAITPVIVPKAQGFESLLVTLIVETILEVLPPNITELNLDNIRVCKVEGGTVHQSHVVHGMILRKSNINLVETPRKECKVLVLGCGLELESTETKGTVLFKTADQLLNFAAAEEQQLENIIKEIADTGVQVIITGGSISDLAQHNVDKYKLLAIKCPSKYELRRVCRTLGATSLMRLGVPKPDEVGYAESVTVEEIGSSQFCVIKARDSLVSTIVLRGATQNLLDELERAIHDGVRCVKNMTKDNRFIAGGGASEIETSLYLKGYGSSISSLEQYAVIEFAEALEEIPRVLAENSGLGSTETLTQLYAAHKQGHKTTGVDTQGITDLGIIDTMNCELDYIIVDHLQTKLSTIKLALDAVQTILGVNQIIMSRPAGGPAPPKQGGDWDAD